MSAPRTLSPTGLYHVTSRGVGQMTLFENDADKRFYLRILKKYQQELGVGIYAWVLMDNHTHLVIDVGEGAAPTDFMRRVNTTYAAYFNSNTGHVGHVFQGDYKSLPICSDAQLMATVDYVHRNPERAGICNMEDYHWSSFQEYSGKRWIVDTSLVLRLFGSLESMRNFVARSGDVVRDKSMKRHASDSEVLKAALIHAALTSSGQLRALPKKHRNAVMTRLSDEGYTARQISRVFGIGESTAAGVIRKSRN